MGPSSEIIFGSEYPVEAEICGAGCYLQARCAHRPVTMWGRLAGMRGAKTLKPGNQTEADGVGWEEGYMAKRVMGLDCIVSTKKL